eukprot:scaffold67988_cov20-Tisochrysis_lutea.AAC.1
MRGWVLSVLLAHAQQSGPSSRTQKGHANGIHAAATCDDDAAADDDDDATDDDPALRIFSSLLLWWQHDESLEDASLDESSNCMETVIPRAGHLPHCSSGGCMPGWAAAAW